jgi:ribosome-associated toxin RatA of RatAB toxin-antitoxin module
MSTVSASALVPVTAQEAFSFIADYRNIPRLQPHFASARLMSAEEKGVGAEVELEGRFHGMPMRVRNRIIAYVEPVRHVSVSEGTVMSRSTWEVEQLSDVPPSTRVTLTVDYKLRDGRGLLGGLGAALWPIFNREIEGMTNDSLRRLRELLTEKS